jgi:uncharacterized repeat protein (TIGR01451 family)
MNKRTLVILPLLLALLCVTAGNVLAQTTPAGTQIRNRSSATYEDLSGNAYSAISNEVITVVLPVFGVSVLPDDSGETPPVTPAMTQNAIPGLTVYFRYDLTNTGNDNDSFSITSLLDAVNTTMTGLVAGDVDVYYDLNGNGIIDAGEPLISAGGAPGILGPLASGATASVIVTYTVPAGAGSGEVSYVGVDATSQGDPAQNDTRNYHMTSVVNDAVMTANLAAAPPVVFETQQITYSFSGTNTGNGTANGVNVVSMATTGVLIYDIIPTDPSTGNPLAIFGVPLGTPAGGTVVYLPNGSSTAGSPETWAWTNTPVAGDIAVGFITNSGIIAGQAYTFGYQVTVPVGMPAGVVNNTVALAYVDNDVVSPDPTVVTSNNAPVTVGATPIVFVGPQNNAAAGTPPNFNDDVTTVATAFANTSVDFVNTVRNDGNATDQINILLDGLSSIPPTWTVLFFESNGATPLVDNGGDGMVDVGPLAALDSVDVVVRLIIPGTQGIGGPFNAVVRAQSSNDPLVYNLTTDRITQVLPSGVDIGNYDGVPGTNDVPLNLFADPGTSVDFPLDVINTGGGPDTYTLSSAIPGGWTATFYQDANGNGLLDPAEMAPIVAIGPVPGGAEFSVIARVDVPAGTLPGVNATSFTATSTNNPGASDTIANTVTVNSFASVDFSPDQAGSTTPGGTISYPHTVTNTGNIADSWDLTFVSSQGWSYVFYDVGNNPITAVTLAPGASENITVRLTVPAGATVGTVETGVLTATGQATLVRDDATDVTVIVAGNLQLTKSAAPPGNQLPGTDLTYTVEYLNIGTDALTAIVVYDAVPNWTWFQVGSATTGTPPASVTGVAVAYSADNGATWAYVPGSGGGGAPAGYDANVTNVRYTLTGDIAAGDGSTIGLGFAVRIMN